MFDWWRDDTPLRAEAQTNPNVLASSPRLSFESIRATSSNLAWGQNDRARVPESLPYKKPNAIRRPAISVVWHDL
jgi:hypothetical protein